MAENRALVTGAAGFSAPWVIRHLLEHGWSVRATDLPNAPRENLEDFGDKIQFIPADLTKPDTLSEIVKDIDIVFHPAALFSYSAPMELLRKVNVEGTKNLLEQCLKADVKKMVLWSSIAAYGAADPKFYKVPIKEYPIEEMNPNIKGKYDLSKREQEAIALKFWEENKFPISIMRPAPLYGPNSYYGMYILFKYIKEGVLTIAPSNLANWKSSIPLVHVEDVARAAIHLADLNRGNGEAYNIVDDNTLDLIDTIRFIATLTKTNFKPIPPVPIKLMYYLLKLMGFLSTLEARYLRKKINGKPPVPHLESDLLVYLNGNFWFDNTKIKETGFSFKYPDRRIGLVDVIDWYNEHGWEKKIALKGSEQMHKTKKNEKEGRK
ncbi:MAG: NAD-dependent epimerase/dehydratase family protein [Candidatus Helarchaeota archaeon]